MGSKTGLALLLACAAWLSGCQPKRDLDRRSGPGERKRSHRVQGTEELPEDVVEGLRSLGYVR